MKKRLRAPSPALVISLLALFVALGGTSYAAVSLPKNSVGPSQLKNNAVTSKKIKSRAVSAAKINTNGLTVPNADNAAELGGHTASDFLSATGTAANSNTLAGHAARYFLPASGTLPRGVTLRGIFYGRARRVGEAFRPAASRSGGD